MSKKKDYFCDIWGRIYQSKGYSFRNKSVKWIAKDSREELLSDQISRFSSSNQGAGSYGDRQKFGVENETGQVTCDEIELKHAQNKRYQKQRVRVSRPIRLLEIGQYQ